MGSLVFKWRQSHEMSVLNVCRGFPLTLQTGPAVLLLATMTKSYLRQKFQIWLINLFLFINVSNLFIYLNLYVFLNSQPNTS